MLGLASGIANYYRLGFILLVWAHYHHWLDSVLFYLSGHIIIIGLDMDIVWSNTVGHYGKLECNKILISKRN